MRTATPHTNRVARTIRLLVVLLIEALVAGALIVTPSPASPTGYNYPVKPFNREHPVRGNFGDPRTIFSVSPTTEGALRGGGNFQFHFGVDVSAPDGTKVYPVVSGIVSTVSTQQRRVDVSCGDGRTFEYWHISPAVDVGVHVSASKTALGRIVRGAKHVHLTERHGATAVNPLQVGHLTPYTDRGAPLIRSITIRKSASTLELPNFVRGAVDLVAEVSDQPNCAVPGIWAGMPVAPARISWRVLDMNGRAVVASRVAVDFTATIPPDWAFWHTYARGSYQNMSVFGRHYSYRQPGRYLFRLARDGFDTRTVKDGVYDLVVRASDIRGNATTDSLRFTVHNRSGLIDG